MHNAGLALSCLKVCVAGKDHAAARSAQVWLVGASYEGVQSVFAGEDGCAEASAPVGAELVLEAQASGLVSKPKRIVMPSKAAASCEDALETLWFAHALEEPAERAATEPSMGGTARTVAYGSARKTNQAAPQSSRMRL